MSEKQSENNLVDYLRWRGDLTFAQDAFNEVDSLLLCLISYINFDHVALLGSKDPRQAMPLGSVCAGLTEKDEQRGLSQENYIPVMRLAADTKRFASVQMFGYESVHDEEKEMQFDAVSFLLPDHSVFVTYMGTDRTLVGWKEDCNMSFLSSIPAQRRAADYAAEIAEACPERMLRLGGHSKGGNLAVWAAVHLQEEHRRRLADAYNNDGPGFNADLTNTEAYRRVADRIHTFIPASSIIGVLLEHTEDYEVIDSSNRAIMQHEPMSWQVMGNHFVHLGQRSQLGKLSDGIIRDWLGSMSPRERETFIDALFDVISRGGKIRTVEELRFGGAALLRGFADSDEETKSIITDKLRLLASEVGEELKKSAEEGLAAAKNGLLSILPDWIK